MQIKRLVRVCQGVRFVHFLDKKKKNPVKLIKSQVLAPKLQLNVTMMQLHSYILSPTSPKVRA